MKAILYQPTVLRVLRKMPANTAKRIIGKVEAYANDPDSQKNNVAKLSGREGIRLRVGDWRVIIKHDEALMVLKIGPRGSVYDE